MNDSYLNLLGLARRASLLESGDEAARGAVSKGAARLILLACDSSDRTRETFSFIAGSAELPCITLPSTREELGNAIGKRPTAVIALCDNGFSLAILKKLAEENEEAKALLPRFEKKAERAKRKKKAARKQAT